MCPVPGRTLKGPQNWLGHTVLALLRGTRLPEERVIGEKKGDGMPRVDVEGVGAVEVPEGKRLVLAIEEDAGVDILHRCGGYARCTPAASSTWRASPRR